MHFVLNASIKNLFAHESSVFSFEDQHNSIKKDAAALQEWLKLGAQANMHFLEKNSEARQNVNLILDNTKTALIFLFPYSHGKNVRSRLGNSITKNEIQLNSLIEKKLISKYVYGKDYHNVIKKKLNEYALLLKEHLKVDFDYRPVVDSVPFFDRAHAREASLGFIGKNTMLIRPGMGSFFFIATLLTTIPLATLAQTDLKRNALNDLNCGSCTKCLDACPTGALTKDYFLDANKCLSYLTIEHRGIVPEKYLSHFKDTIYGCDICQTVCPYNEVTLDSYLTPEFSTYHPPFTFLKVGQLAQMTLEEYQQWFGGTAATRAKYEGIVRNSLYHLYATKDPELKVICENAVQSEYPLIKKTALQILSLSL